MYVFQVGSIVLYVLEGSGLERAGNSGWVVTVWLFGVFIFCRDVRVVFFVISFIYVCLVFFVYWLTL